MSILCTLFPSCSGFGDLQSSGLLDTNHYDAPLFGINFNADIWLHGIRVITTALRFRGNGSLHEIDYLEYIELRSG